MNSVYIEGDSTTFGLMDYEMGGWPNRLHVAALHAATSLEDLMIVANRALPGRTLPGILRELEANMAYYRRFGPTTAVLQAGMNEAKIFPPSTTPIIPAKRFGEQLVRFCTIAEQQECAAVLVGPPPIDTSLDSPTFSGTVIKDELLAEYSGIMRDIANGRGVPYVDTRAVFAGSGRPVNELLAEDGYHPNELGHAALASAVYEVLPFRGQ